MPSITFSYSGTSPATVVTFATGPDMGDFSVKKTWMSPSVKAAGGEDAFIYDKGVVPMFHVITIQRARSVDVTSFLAFLDAVDGISETFDYLDSAGNRWRANIWNAAELRSSLASHNKYNITIELLIWDYFTRNIHDTLSLSDALTRTAAFRRVPADTLTLSDIIALYRYHVYTSNPADNLMLSEIRAMAYRKNLQDSMTLSDARSHVVVYRKDFAETLTLSDVQAFAAGSYYLTDEAGKYITDESGNKIVVDLLQYLHHKDISETIALSDAFATTTTDRLTDELGNYITDEFGKRIQPN